jgi:hypothetical protein
MLGNAVAVRRPQRRPVGIFCKDGGQGVLSGILLGGGGGMASSRGRGWANSVDVRGGGGVGGGKIIKGVCKPRKLDSSTALIRKRRRANEV